MLNPLAQFKKFPYSLYILTSLSLDSIKHHYNHSTVYTLNYIPLISFANILARKTEKKGLMLIKSNSKEGIINIRVEINETRKRKMIEKTQ